MQDTHKKLIYIDTGVIAVPGKTLSDISEFFAMPVELMPVTLDNLLNAINNALRSLLNE